MCIVVTDSIVGVIGSVAIMLYVVGTAGVVFVVCVCFYVCYVCVVCDGVSVDGVVNVVGAAVFVCVGGCRYDVVDDVVVGCIAINYGDDVGVSFIVCVVGVVVIDINDVVVFVVVVLGVVVFCII